MAVLCSNLVSLLLMTIFVIYSIEGYMPPDRYIKSFEDDEGAEPPTAQGDKENVEEAADTLEDLEVSQLPADVSEILESVPDDEPEPEPSSENSASV